MHVISRKRLLEFWSSYPDAEKPLKMWFKLMEKGRYTNFAELKAVFGSADAVGGGLVVFNFGGNKFRLVAGMRYATQTNIGRAYIRHVFTHSEYDDWSDKR